MRAELFTQPEKCQQYRYTMHQKVHGKPNQMDTRKRISLHRDRLIGLLRAENTTLC